MGRLRLVAHVGRRWRRLCKGWQRVIQQHVELLRAHRRVRVEGEGERPCGRFARADTVIAGEGAGAPLEEWRAAQR